MHYLTSSNLIILIIVITIIIPLILVPILTNAQHPPFKTHHHITKCLIPILTPTQDPQ